MKKVTVIVAVYNPGANIDDLLVSLDRQTMPSDDFEVIFSDDDSTDGSRERLQQWAAARPHVRVLHNTPNSGWPSRPRNLAIDVAEGEFLFFADNDDEFTPWALERMYDYAQETGAEIVIPKYAGVGRGIPRDLFRENIPDAKLGKDPILAILTPHKLISTDLVRRIGVRFKEGRVRLEDHMFLMPCYFAASRIAVYAEEVCYYWKLRTSDGQNESSKAFDPAIYFQCVQDAMETVEANTEPGELRKALYVRWYDGKGLHRMRGRWLARRSPEYRDDFLREVARLSDRFGCGEDLWPFMGAGSRLRSRLFHEGRVDDLLAFGTVEEGIESKARLEQVVWAEHDTVRVRFSAQLVYADGAPIKLRRAGEAVYWDVQDRIPAVDVPDIDISDLDPHAKLEALAIERTGRNVRFVPSTYEPQRGDTLRASAVAELDLAALTLAYRDRAIIDLRSRITGAGWGSERRLTVPEGLPLPEERIINEMRVRPYATKGGQFLAFDIRPAQTSKPSEGASTTPATRQARGTRKSRLAETTTSASPGASLFSRGAVRSTLGRVKRKAQSLVSR